MKWHGVRYFNIEGSVKILSASSLIMFTKSRLNLTPEKLHSEGNANKLCVEPAGIQVHDVARVKWYQNEKQSDKKQKDKDKNSI